MWHHLKLLLVFTLDLDNSPKHGICFVVSDVGGGDYFEGKNKIPILGSPVSLIIDY